MSRQKILALSFFPAFVPPENGGVERLVRLYTLLAEEFDVTLISSSHVGNVREIIRHAPNFTEIRVPKDGHFEVCYQELAKHSGDGDVSGPALGASCRRIGALHDAYLEQYADADFIIHDSPFLVECDLFRGFDNKVRIYNSYNFETGLYRSFHSSGDKDKFIEELVEKLERDLCRHVDLITVCAENDRQAFIQNFVPEAPVELLPNGFVPSTPVAPVDRLDNRILFLGSNHKPNVDAARLIVDQFAPELPRHEFHIIGSSYPKGRYGNVVAHGVVDRATKESLLGSATLAINPIYSGSGSSLKIADIAQSGLPLLSTELGARGFLLQAGEHYSPLDAADHLGSIRRALADPERLSAMARSARAHINEHYSWSNIARRFAQRLKLFDRKTPKGILVVNDYDSFTATGGGATRTAGLCRGLSDQSPVIFIAFSSDAESCRRVSQDGKILSVLVDKNRFHLAAHSEDDQLYWISTADIINGMQAGRNDRMREVFRCAASVSREIVCEHPYMVGLPRLFGLNFVYSSQNFELGLKTHVLREHPRGQERIAAVREMESFACGAASLIIAVSEEDARSFGGTYRFTAPILVIPNGADGPAKGRLRSRKRKPSERPVAVFMGSAHGPNVEAAQWIIDELAPAMPGIEFALIGSIAGSVAGKPPHNVRLLGQVSDNDKSRQLYSAAVALNPIISGSGSNVKLADYLQHGLPVVSTPFGSRGYALIPEDDLTVVELSDFAASLEKLICSPAVTPSACAQRQAKYIDALSMDQGGRQLHKLIDEHGDDRRRALYVTYRYNDPAQGGGEDYVVRLVHALAAQGWLVDVVSPAAERIDNVGRFGAAYSGSGFQPVPFGKSRVRSAKFEIDRKPSRSDLERLWNAQPGFEAHYFRSLPNRPNRPALAWGWADGEDRGRWCMSNAGIYMPEPFKLTVAATPIGPMWLQIFSDDGELLHDVEATGPFRAEFELPAGFIELRTSLKGDETVDDPRPLAFFVRRIDTAGTDLLEDRPMEIWAALNSTKQQVASLTDARKAARNGRNLGPVRTGSETLLAYVRENIGNYDLLITHNAVFGETVESVRIAQSADVPSIFIPHLHVDDDFYHFHDVVEACANASRTLVCPSVAVEALAAEGLNNLQYHAPGIIAETQFEPSDAAAFRALLGTDEEFFLVLGRKAAAKGYRDVIDAANQLAGDIKPLVVLIGPDDDQLLINSNRAVYLGRQPDRIVRGALMECLALVNMSRSESFGIVLLEAGLAKKPVLANRGCAAFADLIEHDVNGLLTTPAKLGADMVKLAGNPKLRERLGAAGRLRAQAHDWNLIERQFVGLCDEMVGPR